jgi:hypothetical protein
MDPGMGLTAVASKVLTTVEGAQLIGCLLRIVHAVQEWRNTGIVHTTEVVGD